MTQLPNEPPPFLGVWSRVYKAVVLYLIGIVLLFYWFTRSFNR
jgi:hypothetical protein